MLYSNVGQRAGMSETYQFEASARAFGDGAHPTTRLALAALQSIDPQALQPRMACDMGTGSGITALALQAHFRCPVVAVDMVAEAVETVRRNAAANDVATMIMALQADGFDHPEIAAQGPYEVIVMNILAAPILKLAHAAVAHLAAEGVLILSGILHWQEVQVTEAYQALGLELTARLSAGDWVALVWQKPA